MRWKIRRRYVVGGFAILLVAAGVVLWIIQLNQPRYRGFDGPATVSPTWVTTEFVDGPSVFEVTVAASPTVVRQKDGSDPRSFIIDQKIDRVTVKCNGRLTGDFVPDVLLWTNFTTVGFDPSASVLGCREELQYINLDYSDALRTGTPYPPFTLGFAWGRPVITGANRRPSLPARRLRGRYAGAEEGYEGDFVIDAMLTNGKLQTVSFDCGQGPRPPIRVDSPAPDGAFAMEVAVDEAEDGRCGNTRLTLYGKDPDEARSYLFENNARLVKVGAPGFEGLDVEPYKPKGAGLFGLWPSKN